MLLLLVQTEASNAVLLVMRSVVAATSAVYRCEVSADVTFETDYREINITVLGNRIPPPIHHPICRHRVTCRQSLHRRPLLDLITAASLE